MATIVRVKRRRDEDPLDVLYLTCKKPRESFDDEKKTTDVEKNVFKFAGTVSTKVDGISKPVREAIRKEKLEKEFKRHQADILGEVRHQIRHQYRQNSIQNRFLVKANYRALELDRLDDIVETPEIDKSEETPAVNTENTAQTRNKENSLCQKCGQIIKKDSISDSTDKNLASVEPQTKCSSDDKKHEKGAQKTSGSGQGNSCDCKSQSAAGAEQKTDGSDSQQQAEVSSERVFCLVDMESERCPSFQSLINSCSSDKITCNAQPMTREVVSERERDEDYVYDLYYTNSQQFDFQLFERNLMFEAFSDDFMCGREGDDTEFVNDVDEDDENEENNWRNDYPDEDPGFLENQDAEYYYGEGLEDETAFDNESSGQLADWMNWKCHIDCNELSSDDDLEHYNTFGTSYEQYYRRVEKEMGESSETEDIGK